MPDVFDHDHTLCAADVCGDTDVTCVHGQRNDGQWLRPGQEPVAPVHVHDETCEHAAPVVETTSVAPARPVRYPYPFGANAARK